MARDDAKKKSVKVPAREVTAFRESLGLDQKGLDRLFGFSSEGRASRRWEKDGAPPYVGVLIAYAQRFGADLMEELAVAREAELDRIT